MNGITRPKNLIPKGTGFGTKLLNLPVQQPNGKLANQINTSTGISQHSNNTKARYEHTR